jgi:catechol-2,3-dioxygenase
VACAAASGLTFDHVHLRVADLAESRRFYATVLAPLGFEQTTDRPDLAEFGALTLSQEEPRTAPLHFAFLARRREDVDAFHRAGVEAGYRDNGTPGVREYADDYYAAYLRDPDGHNVEAVHRNPATRESWTWLRWEP